MSSYDHVAYLADVAAIEQVKYRYLRGLDTKHWDDFADTLTDDVKGDYGSSLGEEHHFTNRADLVEFMRSSLGPGVVTEHRVTHPEITVTGDEATGVWYLQDRVIVAEFNFMPIMQLTSWHPGASWLAVSVIQPGPTEASLIVG